MDRNSSSCCVNKSGCCTFEAKERNVNIDFLYLDLEVCGRCQGTEAVLDDAICEVSSVLKASGYNVVINKVHINSEELAIKYKFISSPTIRINGKDIETDIKESLCEDCGDLCGDSVDCRIWIYGGLEYSTPPKALITDAILKAVYSGSIVTRENEKYVLPQNLKTFFDAMKKKE